MRNVLQHIHSTGSIDIYRHYYGNDVVCHGSKMCAMCSAKWYPDLVPILILYNIREYGSTLYVGMTRVKNGGRIKRVQ